MGTSGNWERDVWAPMGLLSFLPSVLEQMITQLFVIFVFAGLTLVTFRAICREGVKHEHRDVVKALNKFKLNANFGKTYPVRDQDLEHNIKEVEKLKQEERERKALRGTIKSNSRKNFSSRKQKKLDKTGFNMFGDSSGNNSKADKLFVINESSYSQSSQHYDATANISESGRVSRMSSSTTTSNARTSNNRNNGLWDMVFGGKMFSQVKSYGRWKTWNRRDSLASSTQTSERASILRRDSFGFDAENPGDHSHTAAHSSKNTPAQNTGRNLTNPNSNLASICEKQSHTYTLNEGHSTRGRKGELYDDDESNTLVVGKAISAGEKKLQDIPRQNKIVLLYDNVHKIYAPPEPTGWWRTYLWCCPRRSNKEEIINASNYTQIEEDRRKTRRTAAHAVRGLTWADSFSKTLQKARTRNHVAAAQLGSNVKQNDSGKNNGIQKNVISSGKNLPILPIADSKTTSPNLTNAVTSTNNCQELSVPALNDELASSQGIISQAVIGTSGNISTNVTSPHSLALQSLNTSNENSMMNRGLRNLLLSPQGGASQNQVNSGSTNVNSENMNSSHINAASSPNLLPISNQFQTIQPPSPKLKSTQLFVDPNRYQSKNRGAVLGVLGANGCGKTSLFKMTMGLESITAGKIRIFGMEPEKHLDEIRSLTGYCPQEDLVPEHMDVEAILLWFGHLKLSNIYNQNVGGYFQKKIDRN